MSFPSIPGGMESACTGVGSVKPRFSMASNEGLDKPSVLKVEVVMPFSVGDGRAIVYAEDKQWYTFPMHLMPFMRGSITLTNQTKEALFVISKPEAQRGNPRRP